MRRCIANYVPVISKETHITHGNGVHVADAGTRWCCIGRELCVCIDALRTMCTCYFQEDVHIRRDAVQATDEAKCSWFINHELRVCVDKLRTMYLSCPRKHASYTRMECMLQMLVRTAGVFVKMWVYASMRCKLCTCHFTENTHITHENGVHVADVGTHCWCVSHKLNFVCVCAEEDRRTASAWVIDGMSCRLSQCIELMCHRLYERVRRMRQTHRWHLSHGLSMWIDESWCHMSHGFSLWIDESWITSTCAQTDAPRAHKSQNKSMSWVVCHEPFGRVCKMIQRHCWHILWVTNSVCELKSREVRQSGPTQTHSTSGEWVTD